MKKSILITIAIIIASCANNPQNVRKTGELPDIFPDYIDVTVPSDIAPLNFSMADDNIETMDVTISGQNGTILHSRGKYADFDIDDWHDILSKNIGKALKVNVTAKKSGQWTEYLPFTINVGREPLGEWGLTYRRVAPTYEHYGIMGIYQRCLGTFDESPLIDNSRNASMCVNCHTSNRFNPEEYVFQVRGPHGATVIHRNGKYELLQGDDSKLGGTMVYPYWHPGGRYCAFSTNNTSQMFHTSGKKRTEVYDIQSDIYVYDAENNEMQLDTIVMRKYWAENTPVFSPDGKWLYFTTAKRQSYPTDYDKERYSICRISFDDKTGRLGSTVDTLVSAEQTGKSATWPRPSFDGRFIMYTQCYYGYFSIWHSESDLWLLDLESGNIHPIEEANSPNAESFPNWSTNSHWFVFTSRREDGVYTHLYIASIDDKGRSTKPFLLPQRNPKAYYRLSLFSFNTPDFTAKKIPPNKKTMLQYIESDKRTTAKTVNMR